MSLKLRTDSDAGVICVRSLARSSARQTARALVLAQPHACDRAREGAPSAARRVRLPLAGILPESILR